MPKRSPGKRPREKRVYKKAEPKWKKEVQEIEQVKALYETLGTEEVAVFNDLPLSKRTKDGLADAGYATPTEIQREAIPLALLGRDVLGAAKTGSGKTLAFLVPILERLWCERWSGEDGIGALIISPTRELAYQSFEVLRKVGHHHDFSAGLVIGGKSLEAEQSCIQHTNIVVCTPGRLLQHMDETPDFHCSSMKILVLDEADRILDLGFQRTVNAIIDNLPPERQTLLFSATQTKSVRDLARLSLKDAEYVAVHEDSQASTPHRLSQSYIVVDLPDKLNTLFSFIKSHLTSKMIVFISSCKQVKFTYEAFCRLRPGVPLMALYGKQKQMRRVGIYNDFCRKKSAVLLCTDIAARGLDFPAVHWVVQLDCPEDANTYIHRVGRTARYEADGKALLFLLPSEEPGMLEALQNKKIPIQMIRVNPKRTTSIQKKLEQFCAQDPEMKHWAQRSFICYLRSIHLQSNKKVFDLHSLPTTEYSESLGLAQPPRIRILKQGKKLQKEERGRTDDAIKREEEEKEEGEEEEEEESQEEVGEAEDISSESSEGEGDILRVKRVIEPGDMDEAVMQELEASSTRSRRKKGNLHALNEKDRKKTKFTLAKKLIRKKIKVNTHITFDEDGSAMEETREKVVGDEEEEDGEGESEGDYIPVPIEEYESGGREVGGIDLESARETMRKRDKAEKMRERERVRSVHRELRRKRKREGGGEEGEVVLRGGAGEEEESGGDESAQLYVKKQRMVEREELEDSAKLSDDEELALHLLNT